MHRVDTSTAVATMPAPGAAGTPGYFTEGNPLSGTPATIPGQAWLNAIQEELVAILVAAGISPSKTNNAQVLAAIQALIAEAVADGDNLVVTGTAEINGGIIYVDALNSSSDAVVYLRNQAGVVQGAVRWDRASDTIRLQRHNALGDTVEGELSLGASSVTLNGTPLALTTNAGLRPAWSSAQQTISAAGSFGPLAHGLGVVPKIVQLDLVCLTAELGYSVGDVVPVSGWNGSENDADRVFGCAIVKSATSISGRYASYGGQAPFRIPRWDDGTQALITAASWALVVNAIG